jgi:hypothetical protein
VWFAGLADQIFAFFFDGFGQPHAAHVGVRAVVQDRVFFDRHLLGEVVALLAPTLELLLGAFAVAKDFFPRMGRALVVLPVHLEEGFDEFIRIVFV